VLIAFAVDGHDAFKPAADQDANFALFAGFFVGSQVIERIFEVLAPLIPPPGLQRGGADDATKAANLKADRGSIFLGLGVLVGVILSGSLGLYFLQAIGMEVSNHVDMLLSGIVISGGTKSLHELIKAVEKQKKVPAA
jgi:hypothetical protein